MLFYTYLAVWVPSVEKVEIKSVTESELRAELKVRSLTRATGPAMTTLVTQEVITTANTENV